MAADVGAADGSMSTLGVPGLEYPSIEVSSKMPSAPKFSFSSGRSKHLDTTVDNPGPGSYFESYGEYFTSKRPKAPMFSFGATTRTRLNKSRVPGPGAYDQKSSLGTNGVHISMNPGKCRGIPTNSQHTPGPGAHEWPPSAAVSHGPQHTMTPRRRDRETETVPGPGKYESSFRKTAPGYGFGSAAQRPKTIQSAITDHSTPGPGSYRHNEGLNGSGPKYSMRAKSANAKVAMLQEL